MKKTVHLLPNAHLDPVWLWDWRDGLNEGVSTCRCMVRLMRKYPSLTFLRGEASIYEHIRQFDPETFEAIRELVREGRWEIVGGNYVQTDTNMPDTEVMMRQYRVGRAYFRKWFGVDVKTAWAPDSFGHAAGFPDIYRRSGFECFAFTRGVRPLMPQTEKPVFRWKGVGGNEILTLFDRINVCYCTNRVNMIERLDNVREKAPEIPMRNLALFFGMGDHGGGPTERNIEEILRWSEAHSDEFDVRFSTLGAFFAACTAEDGPFPEYSGEINFCLRGCTASALKVKSDYRRAEGALLRAERVTTRVAELLQLPVPDWEEEWKDLLFNTFHDILPGSAIDRALIEQQEWMKGLVHRARRREFEALNRLGASLEMRVPAAGYDLPEAVPFLIFNPLSVPVRTFVELECNLDARPLPGYRGGALKVPAELLDENGEPLAFQLIEPEHDALPPGEVWRARCVTELDLPAGGYRVVSFGHVPEPRSAAARPGAPAAAVSERKIANGCLSVEVADNRIFIERDGKRIFAEGGLRFAAFRDAYGSWGAMDEAEDGWTCPEELAEWELESVKAVERGPERAALFAVFRGGRSQVRLKLALERGSDRLTVSGQLIWQERAERLRLVFDPVEKMTCQIPGGEIVRTVPGDVPCGRYLKFENGWGLASDVFASVGSQREFFALTLVRGCRAASCSGIPDEELQERPIIDYGDHLFRLVFAPAERIEQEAELLKTPPVAVRFWPHGAR